MCSIIYLDKFNMRSISFDFGKPMKFFGTEMFFLECPIRYAFDEPIEIQSSTYNLKMVNIPEKDIDILNGFFARMNRNLKISDTCYINYKENYEDLFRKGNKQKFQVQIQGYKVTKDIVSPIWRIIPEKYY